MSFIILSCTVHFNCIFQTRFHVIPPAYHSRGRRLLNSHRDTCPRGLVAWLLGRCRALLYNTQYLLLVVEKSLFVWQYKVFHIRNINSQLTNQLDIFSCSSWRTWHFAGARATEKHMFHRTVRISSFPSDSQNLTPITKMRSPTSLKNKIFEWQWWNIRRSWHNNKHTIKIKNKLNRIIQHDLGCILSKC